MAQTSGFFRSVSGDRKYDVKFLARWAAAFVSRGVYNGELEITAGDGMTAILPVGRAWNGPDGECYKYENDSPIVLTISNADGVLHRKDTVVLRWDINERSITVQVLQGAFSSNPTAPEIVRNAEQYDLKLAEISIPAGTTAITNALITDTRLENSVCGIVTGVIDQVDTTTLYNQIQSDLQHFRSVNEAGFTAWSDGQKADFDAWFAGVKDILGEDEAGNLLNLINDHKADGSAHITTYAHTKTGAVHDFSGAGSNGKAHINADFVVGDTFTVNGQPVTAKLQNGEQPTGEFFKAGCWVQFIYDADANQLNFSAGASKQIATTYAGKLTVSVAAYDGGSIASTKVRIQNTSLGMDMAYTPDALGKVTLQLQGNKTYYISLISFPEGYYGQASSVNVAYDSDNQLTLQLLEQPEIIGFKINKASPYDVTYTDGAEGWTPMTMNTTTGELDFGSFYNSWLLQDIRPCMVKDGVVQYYFKKTGFMQFDYSQQENGLPTDIVSGADGDVMIEHPLLFYKAYEQTDGTGSYFYAKFTRSPMSGWTAAAFSDITGIFYNTIYFNAYAGTVLNGQIRSLSGKTIDDTISPADLGSPDVYQDTLIDAIPSKRLISGTDVLYLYLLHGMMYKTVLFYDTGYANITPTIHVTGTMNSYPLCYGLRYSVNKFKFLGMENPFNRTFISTQYGDRVNPYYANSNNMGVKYRFGTNLFDNSSSTHGPNITNNSYDVTSLSIYTNSEAANQASAPTINGWTTNADDNYNNPFKIKIFSKTKPSTTIDTWFGFQIGMGGASNYSLYLTPISVQNNGSPYAIQNVRFFAVLKA